jgi:hypothetical protein
MACDNINSHSSIKEYKVWRTDHHKVIDTLIFMFVSLISLRNTCAIVIVIVNMSRVVRNWSSHLSRPGGAGCIVCLGQNFKVFCVCSLHVMNVGVFNWGCALCSLR